MNCTSTLNGTQCERDFHEKGDHYAHYNGELIQWVSYAPAAPPTGEGTTTPDSRMRCTECKEPVCDHLAAKLIPWLENYVQPVAAHDITCRSLSSSGKETCNCSVAGTKVEEIAQMIAQKVHEVPYLKLQSEIEAILRPFIPSQPPAAHELLMVIRSKSGHMLNKWLEKYGLECSDSMDWLELQNNAIEAYLTLASPVIFPASTPAPEPKITMGESVVVPLKRYNELIKLEKSCPI